MTTANRREGSARLTSPICRHFGTCGGCSLQNIPEREYRTRKREVVERVLARHRVAIAVQELVSVPPRTRRRTSLKVGKTASSTVIGFHAAASHAMVDMTQCHVLTPGLTKLAGGLRGLMHTLLRDGDTAEITATETETGFDIAINWSRKATPALTAEISRQAERLGITRVTAGGKILASFSEPIVRLAGVEVFLPPSAFLQSTVEGELFLQSYAATAVKGAKRIADLFAGCGTLSFAVAQIAPVHAVELDPAMLGALVDAARKAKGLKKITAERRNLFRQPLAREELSRFDTVILDPPRAGAEAQARELAGSGVRRILYVSCDPQSFARDAVILLGGGYTASAVTPVDQFIWSEHIELVALFEAGAGGPPKSIGP